VAIVAEKVTSFPDGEWVPSVPRDVRLALRDDPWSLALWIEAQARPQGWQTGNRQQMAADMGWPVYRIRKAIAGLRRVGLYLVTRMQDAAGRWSTVCQLVARLASPQVAPEAHYPAAGRPAPIPPMSGSKRESGRPAHSPITCARNAAGLACRDCGKAQRETFGVPARLNPPERRSVRDLFGPASIPATYRPWRERLAAVGACC
jgi:hypothetical protein